MSDKKGLKQSRLPFQILPTSPKVTSDIKPITNTEQSASSKTAATSRKRKQSNEGDNLRSTKIGRTNSKENIIAEQDPIEILDSSDESSGENGGNIDSINASSKIETTPTSSNTPTESKLRIKIQSSCSKRKQVHKPIEDNEDDSIVYIGEEELKSLKSNKKKKSKDQKVSKEKSKRIKKLLDLKDSDQNDTAINEENKTVIDDENMVFDEDGNERSDADFEGRSKVDSKIESIKDQLGKCMNDKSKNMKNVKVMLHKVLVSDVNTQISESKQTSENDKETVDSASKKDQSDSEDNSKSSISQNVSNANDNNQEEKVQPQVMSEELSKLVDSCTEGEDDSPSKDINNEFIEIMTDDEKKSPTHPNVESVTKTTPNLTPKALARRKELEAKRIEKELQRQKEKEEKEKQRLKEKEMREEAKKKEREEKEEMRKREKEEREKKRLAEIEKKEEEKRLKEEERKRLIEQKEEEKRTKEEERRQKEEERKRQNEAREEERKKRELEKVKEEERKKKAAQAFSKFFVPTKKKSDSQIIEEELSKDSAESSEAPIGNFMPFQIHGKMRLAPRIRNEISIQQKLLLDNILKSEEFENDENKLYLRQLKSEGYAPKCSLKTWPEEDDAEKDDVVIVDELEGVGEDIKEDEAHLKMKHRAKLLLFNENRRPAYYGTWRKKSKSIYARRPFAQDSKFFDYEVDSDEEWEEEEPGESLHGSDSEKEKDDDDYEVDDDFFVPHGHLSEDEMQHDDEIMEDNSPEAQKAKLKVLQQEFAAEMKKKTEKIKPRLIGCIWMNGDEDEDGGSKIDNLEKKYHCSDIIWRILKAREMMASDDIKMEDFEPEIIESEEENEEKAGKRKNNEEKQQKTPAQIKIRPKIEGDSLKELIRLLHGNVNSKKFIIKEFQAYRLKNFHKLADFQEFSYKSVDEKITEISDYKTCPDECALFGKKCWYVKEDVVKEYYGDEKLPLPTQWTYILSREKKAKPNNNCGDSKKESREVTPDDPMTGIEPIIEAPKIIPESPKPSIVNANKITNFVKSSPKNPSSSLKKDLPSQSPKPVTVKPYSTSNGSPKVQASTSATNNVNSGKKRVAILMSVQRGASINEDKKKLLINQFLKTNQKSEVKPMNDNEVIEIID